VILLAIDTSTQVVGIAIYNGSQVLAESTWTSQAYHTVELAPAVADILDKTRVNLEDITAVAIALGPGSYTGLRIGMALAKGIAFARHLGIVGIPSLEILAAAQPRSDLPMVAALRIGRGRLAIGWYRWGREGWTRQGDLESVTPQSLAERLTQATIVCGELGEEGRRLLTGMKKLAILASPANCLRRPSYLAELGWRRIQSKGSDDPATLTPIYLQTIEPVSG
jgi:tRNA threonylcarbamoyladenosine biosynthesis protein TsaB